ncbi:MAG: GntR family transcriptional regulator [Victivallaceae bacterium]|nr:GntR family transcriptional regulator [Victivallaceae bacterium]
MEIFDLGSESKYKVLTMYLKKAIESGEFKPGSKLPSENELVSMYNISRPTVREAISGLMQGGLVDRIHGKGTFVTMFPEIHKAQRVNLFLDESFKGDKNPVHSFYNDFMFQLNLQLNMNNFIVKPHFISTQNGFDPTAFEDLDTPAVFVGNYLFKYHKDALQYSENLKNPTVFVDYSVSGKNVVSIVSKNEYGGECASEHLIKQGFRKVGFIGRKTQNHQLRFKGYCNALKKHKIKYDENIVWFDLREACSEITRHPDILDGIFCAADHVAINFVNFFRRAGSEIKNHIQLISYDYTGALNLAGINIPGIFVDRHEMAKKVVDVLNGKEKRKYIEVRTELEVTESDYKEFTVQGCTL